MENFMITCISILVVCIFAFFMCLEYRNKKRKDKARFEHLLNLEQKSLSELFEMVQAGSVGMYFHGLGWGSYSVLTAENSVSKIGNTHVKIKNRRVPIGTVSYDIPARFRFETISENPFDIGNHFYKENDKKIPVIWFHCPNKDTYVYVLLNSTIQDLDGIFKAAPTSTVLKG